MKEERVRWRREEDIVYQKCTLHMNGNEGQMRGCRGKEGKREEGKAKNRRKYSLSEIYFTQEWK